MLIVNGIFLPRSLLSARFHCPYDLCKGKCCVEGDRGAPLLQSEISLIRSHLPFVLPDLDADASESLKDQPFFEGPPNDAATLCIGGSGRCVFARQESHNNISCNLEIYSRQAGIPTLRPVSCRLFPIRIRTFNGLEIIDYEIWEECRDGWNTGPLLLDFCRIALGDRFGQSWLEKLDAIRLKSASGS